MVVIGKPIPVPQLARSHPDFEATVDAMHAEVVEALTSLYGRYRHLYHDGTSSWKDRPLVLV
jgi:hypothetical protein